MEYAALGIPFVASPLPEYRWLSDTYGLGVLAENRSRAWRRAIKQLLRDDGRAALGVAYRSTVARRLTVAHNAWRWAEVWQSVLGRRRAAA